MSEGKIEKIKRIVLSCPKCNKSQFTLVKDQEGDLSYLCEDCNILYLITKNLEEKEVEYWYNVPQKVFRNLLNL